jgi:hypothetical protein
MDSYELEQEMDKVFRDLARGVGDGVEADRVDAVGHDKYEWLRQDATINDFLPLLVYRYTKEELVRSRHSESAKRPDSSSPGLSFRLRSSRSRAGRRRASQTGRVARRRSLTE